MADDGSVEKSSGHAVEEKRKRERERERGIGAERLQPSCIRAYTRVYARTHVRHGRETERRRGERKAKYRERERRREKDAARPWKERRERSKYCRDRYIQRSRPDSALNLARNPRLHGLMI